MRQKKQVKLKDVKALAVQTAEKLKGGEVFGLIGPLGSGKTAFVKALGKALKIKSTITSPSFVIMQEYQGKLKNNKQVQIYHLDLYRINSLNEIKHLGLEDFWQNKNQITLIEWADKLKTIWPKNTQFIEFSH